MRHVCVCVDAGPKTQKTQSKTQFCNMSPAGGGLRIVRVCACAYNACHMSLVALSFRRASTVVLRTHHHFD
jgi:hypothetical protein